jgi:hypothetical protein
MLTAMAVVAAIVVSIHPPGARAQSTNLYWGETHLHTSYSSDAYGWGTINNDPDSAYRFAKGLPVIHPTLGNRVQLRRPLDFMAISDHGIGFGNGAPVELGGRGAAYLPGTPEAIRNPVGFGQDPDEIAAGGGGVGRGGAAGAQAGRGGAGGAGRGGAAAGRGGAGGRGEAQIAQLEATWPLYVDAAERHNDPGTFTTLVGWEWTSLLGGNQHRVVFTPADGETAKQFIPFTSRDSPRPEDLWNWLDETSERLGIDFVAIPHNSNISNGLMFDLVDSDGRPITAELARQRIRWEPVVEVAQIKGTSETHPALSPNDEFANFEIYMFLLQGGVGTPNAGDYVRTALMRGLELEESIGVNPYKFGMQAATDSHTALTTSEEDYFFGKSPIDTNPMAGPYRMMNAWDTESWDYSAQGITGVWATGNTRQSIAAAFKRKEVYASTGPRMSLRVFGGFGFSPIDAGARDIAGIGYSGGVPMGGDLSDAPQGEAVSLLIQAVKDPMGANLDRVQVVKGWLDANDMAQERVYDVVMSEGRTVGANGSVDPVGNTVDLTTGKYENSIGAAQLATVWEDPDFDPDARAFYYVRVLEIPTPRHSTLDAISLDMDPETAYDGPATIQERAYSSPIWYTP